MLQYKTKTFQKAICSPLNSLLQEKKAENPQYLQYLKTWLHFCSKQIENFSE